MKFKDNMKKAFRILKVVYKSSKVYFYGFIFQGILQSIFPYISIVYMLIIIDGVVDGVSKNTLYGHVFTMVGLSFAIGLLINITRYITQKHVYELNYQLTTMIALKTYELDYEQVEDKEVMNLLQKAKEGQNGNGGLSAYCEMVLGTMLSSFLSIIYGFVLLSSMLFVEPLQTSSTLKKFMHSPWSFSIIIIALMIPAVISYYLMKRNNKLSYEAMIANTEGNRRFGYFFQICCNYKLGKDFRLFHMQDLIHDIMTSDKYYLENSWRDYNKKQMQANSISILANQVLTFLAYIYVGIKALLGLITIGSVVSYVAGIALISQSITRFIRQYARMQLFNSYLENYFIYLSLPTKKTYGDVDKLDEDNLKIEFKNVSFKYDGQKEYALKNVNFTINEKEKLAIVGKNGAGKTTVIKLICRLYDPSEGEILINDIPLKNYSKNVVKRLYSVVFQDFKLFSYSIKNNVSASSGGEEEKVIDCLQKSGFEDRLSTLEDGIDTIIYQRNKENGVEISGGEAQKIAISRALYKNSPIVVLDEPTAALDPKSEAEIYEKFKNLVTNKTSIFISHRMSSCRFCDTILVMDNGEVVEEGTHKKLLENKSGLYTRMWSAQSQYYM